MTAVQAGMLVLQVVLVALLGVLSWVARDLVSTVHTLVVTITEKVHAQDVLLARHDERLSALEEA